MARFTFVIATLLFTSLIAALPTPQNPDAAGGNAYSGAGGPANGGASMRNGGLINVLSNNGGTGGDTSTGDAEAGNYPPVVQPGDGSGGGAASVKSKSKVVKVNSSKFRPTAAEACPGCTSNINSIENKFVHKGLLGLGIIGL